MTNKLSLEIEVIDTGKIKVKQFADAINKVIEDIHKSSEDLTSTSARLQEQFTKLISTVGTKKAFEELRNSVEKTDAVIAGFGLQIGRIIIEISKWFGVYKLFEALTSQIKDLTIGTRQFEDELRKLQERLEKLHTAPKVFGFLKEKQIFTTQQPELLQVRGC